MASCFPDLSGLFLTPSLPKNIQSFQIVKALILGLPNHVERSSAERIAADLVVSVFKFNQVIALERNGVPNGELFIEAYARSVALNEPLDLSQDPWSINGLPVELRDGFHLEPLCGANTAVIIPSTHKDGAPIDRRWILLWYTNHPQRTDVCLYILDNKENIIYGLPTYKLWIYDDLLWICRSRLDISAWTNPALRTKFFQDLPSATSLALTPSNCPIHYGHYLQNNLAHLSRLEELKITDLVDKVYRPKTFDYFTPEEEELFYSPALRSKITWMDNDEDIEKLALEQKIALIKSKGATFGKQLSKRFLASLSTEEKIKEEQPNSLKICVGIRGGTRMALNLIEVVEAFSQALHQRLGRTIHLVIDGMSKSSLNHHDTTRLLSTETELQIADQYFKLAERNKYLTVTSVVNMTQLEQLKQISQCDLAISGYGTSTFKYMYLCDIPTIVHGERAPYDYLSAGMPPSSLFLGLDCVQGIEKNQDSKRNNYSLDIDKFINLSMDYAEEHATKSNRQTSGR